MSTSRPKGRGGSELTTGAEVRSAAIELLARREYSRREIYTKLSRRVTEIELLESVLDWLEEQGYLSDQRCAVMLARQRLSQGCGERRIRFDLQQKGIASELIELAIQGLNADWFELAVDVVRRKYGTRSPQDFKEKAKWMRHLQGRGFGFDEIDYALSQAMESE